MRILITGWLLICFWLLAIYSVSIYESFGVTLKMVDAGVLTEPSNYFYFFRQLRNVLAGLVLGIAIYKIPMKFWQSERNTLIIFVVTFILQILVFTPVGIVLNGARGWLNLGITTIQPSEFFKLGYIVFLAGWLLRKKFMLKTRAFYTSFIVINICLLGIFLLIPDIGTVLVLGLTGLVMCRYAGWDGKILWGMLIGGIGLGIVGAFTLSAISPKFNYLKQRVTYFVSNTTDPKNRDIGWQSQQALIAIGGGGFFGNGYGKGLQKFGYIPEAQSDFIFSAFSEELGFAWNIVLLALYFALAYYFLVDLHYVKNEYVRVFWVGLISLLIIQMFVNIGVNLKIMPNTGLTLPFISFGWSAMMVNMMQVALLYKIIANKDRIPFEKSQTPTQGHSHSKIRKLI